MNKTILLLVTGLVFLSGCGAVEKAVEEVSEISQNTFELGYTTGDSTSTITFTAGNYTVLLIDQNVADTASGTLSWEYCVDADSASCSTISTTQNTQTGTPIGEIDSGELTSSTTSLTVDFVIDSGDTVVLNSTDTTCLIYNGAVSCGASQ